MLLETKYAVTKLYRLAVLYVGNLKLHTFLFLGKFFCFNKRGIIIVYLRVLWSTSSPDLQMFT